MSNEPATVEPAEEVRPKHAGGRPRGREFNHRTMLRLDPESERLAAELARKWGVKKAEMFRRAVRTCARDEGLL